MKNYYYDDNYGSWNDGGDAEERDEMHKFYKKVKSESVWKTCSLCGGKVKLRPEYDKCNSCMERLESGMEW